MPKKKKKKKFFKKPLTNQMKVQLTSAALVGGTLGAGNALIREVSSNPALLHRSMPKRVYGRALAHGLAGASFVGGAMARDLGKVKNNKDLQNLGTGLMVGPAMGVAGKYIKPTASEKQIKRALNRDRSTGGGYKYRGRFGSGGGMDKKSEVVFEKYARSLKQGIKAVSKVKKVGKIGLDPEALAVARDNKVTSQVVEKLTGNKRFTASRVRHKDIKSYGEGKGLTEDPTAAIEFNPRAHKNVDKVMASTDKLISKADKIYKKHKSTITGYASLPSNVKGHRTSRTGPRTNVDAAEDFMNTFMQRSAGGHVHLDAPKDVKKGVWNIWGGTTTADRVGKKGREVIDAVSGASVLPHLLVPGAARRARKTPYGAQPITKDYKLTEYGILVPKTGIEMRSAPTFLSDPRLTKSYLETSQFLAHNPEAKGRMAEVMRKNKHLTPTELLSSGKKQKEVLDGLENALHHGGITSDPTLAYNLKRISEGRPYIEEGWDIGKSWKKTYPKIKDLK